jgi:hypothetical protein
MRMDCWSLCSPLKLPLIGVKSSMQLHYRNKSKHGYKYLKSTELNATLSGDHLPGVEWIFSCQHTAKKHLCPSGDEGSASDYREADWTSKHGLYQFATIATGRSIVSNRVHSKDPRIWIRVVVLRKHRMGPHRVVHAKTHKPAVQKVVVDLLNQ